ncbi:MAG: metal-sensing transcriptional repressor [Oscillibacter sp.]|nr:metal-sensing transcriptional repressor [Oscillibacter sp.]
MRECRLSDDQACCHKTKHRDPEEYDALTKRLSRIEGQIRGIRGMVEKDAYCTDILTQVSAAQAALNAFSRELLENHIRTCVVQDIQNGQMDVIDDLMKTIQKLIK